MGLKKAGQSKASVIKQQREGGTNSATVRSSHREAESERRKARTLAKKQQASERIAAATSQLASGINEAASSVEELTRSMEQVASGAEQATGAAQESLQAITQSSKNILLQMDAAQLSQDKSEILQTMVVGVSAEITKSITAISEGAKRQDGSVRMVAELEKYAGEIVKIVKAVIGIADQTNLLALNAAIEAASAGQHGKGFAVVADEVRALAETSENSATQIDDLVKQIQQEVGVISKGINEAAETITKEVGKGATVTEQLEQMRSDLIVIAEGGELILTASQQADTAAKEAQKGAEDIAASAEEQSSAAEASAKTLSDQNEYLAQAEQASQALADLADELKDSSDIAKSAEEVAANAEELSDSVQQINRASSEISTALEQILRSAKLQAAATEQSSTAIAQIEKSADLANERATTAVERSTTMSALLAANKVAVDEMITGVSSALAETKQSAVQISTLGKVATRIDKIVDSINTVSVQTSMLAVSGSIEAARAGEFGKGFVVVSTDIRNLATESAENADRIKDTVKAVQDQIAIVQRDLEEIATTATAELENTRSITTKLVTMEADVKAVLEGNKRINASAEEIGTAITEVKKGVDQIASSAAETEQASTQASTAAEQQSRGAEDLAGAIEEIASLADELQSS